MAFPFRYMVLITLGLYGLCDIVLRALCHFSNICPVTSAIGAMSIILASTLLTLFDVILIKKELGSD